MRILKRHITKGVGFVQIIPQEEEDLWHLYNLLTEGDQLKSLTTRKIINTSVSGVKKSMVKKFVITIEVTKIEYHASDHLAIVINGKNCVENDYIALNKFHSFQVMLDNPLTIIKDNWSGYHYKILREMSDPTHDSDVAAMVMDEGIAHICYVKSTITLLKNKIEKSIPKKKAGADQKEKQMKIFFQMCFDSLINIDFSILKCFIIASPGFVKDEFLKFIREKAQSADYSQKFKQNAILQKIIICSSSTGYMNGLSEALQDEGVMKRLQDTKAVKQVKIFDEFYKTLSKDENMVAYSKNAVLECYHQKAIQTLLISDKLFKTKDLKERKFYNALVDSINRQGGEAHIFSSMHTSGNKLNNLTGIAAILKFPVIIEDEDDEDDDDEEDEEEENQIKTKTGLSSGGEEEKEQNEESKSGENKKQKGGFYTLIDLEEDDDYEIDDGDKKEKLDDDKDFKEYQKEEYCDPDDDL